MITENIPPHFGAHLLHQTRITAKFQGGILIAMDEYEEYTQNEIAHEYAKVFPVEDYPFPEQGGL